MRHLFVVNPVAGKMAPEEKIKKVREGIDALSPALREGAEFEIYMTRAPMDACRKIRAEAEGCQALRVYACGGDGTLNECVNGAAGFGHVAVTHFPCGTGNDFIKTFGDEKARFSDIAALVGGEVRPVDLIRCNDRYSVNICSAGLDARIGTSVHKYSAIPLIGGATGYVTSTLVNLAQGVSQPLRVKCCGREFNENLTLICICNGRYYGGSFNPVPTALPDDGILDILVVKHVSRLRALSLILTYAKGQFRKLPQYITHLRGQRMEIDSDGEIVINLDGEAMFAKHVELSLIPRGLNFIFPANMVFFKNYEEKSGENRSKWEISIS